MLRIICDSVGFWLNCPMLQSKSRPPATKPPTKGLLMNTTYRNRNASRQSPVVRVVAMGFLSCAALTSHAEARFSFAATPGQLSKGVVPSAYRLDLAADLEQLKFSGREEIDVDVVKATDVITVNAV